MAELERVITAVPLWLLREYLEDAGGTAYDEQRVTGERWTATLAQAPDHVVGSLRVGRVQLVIRGDDDAVDATWAALEPRLLRAGG